MRASTFTLGFPSQKTGDWQNLAAFEEGGIRLSPPDPSSECPAGLLLDQQMQRISLEFLELALPLAWPGGRALAPERWARWEEA